MKTHSSIYGLGTAALAAAMLWGGLQTGGAAVVNSPDDSGAGSLRQAIADASEGELITFSVTGTITLTSGQLDIRTNLTIQGPGAKSLTIDGNYSDRIFHIHSGVTNANIAGVTLTHGRIIDGTDATGGGILNEGTLNLTACHLYANYAFGSAAPLDFGGMASGGGIFSRGKLTLTACTLQSNYAYGGDGASGGTAQGGGIFNDHGSLALTNCTLAFNIARGGHASGFGDEGGSVTGGAVSHYAGECAIVNCTIRLNSGIGGDSDYDLGGMPFGGGISGFDPCTILNTILCDNAAIAGDSGGDWVIIPTKEPDVYGWITSLGHNLAGGVGGWATSPGDKVVLPWAAQMGPLDDNGGPTPTMAVSPTSPAYDAGDDVVLGPSYNLTTDQRDRPRWYGAHVDIGAYEWRYEQTTNVFIPQGRWETMWPPIHYIPICEITNGGGGFNTVLIDSITAGSYSNTLTILDLLISAPYFTTNLLLLSDAGLATPLSIQRNLFLREGGALTASNSAIEMSSTEPPSNGMYNASSVIIDGPVSIRQGRLDTSHAFATAIGNAAPGSLELIDSSFQAYELMVGCGSTGTVQLVNSTSVLSHALYVATAPQQTGHVSIVGGQFTATNALRPDDYLLVLDHGSGQVIFSNATVEVGDTVIGSFGQGSSLVLQSGTARLGKTYVGLKTNYAGPPAEGFLVVSDGQMSMPELHIGVEGYGHAYVVGGTLSNATVTLAEQPGAFGDLMINGDGTHVVSSALTAGNTGLVWGGQVLVNGGALLVTNASHSAMLTLNQFPLHHEAGRFQADNLVVTNGGALTTVSSISVAAVTGSTGLVQVVDGALTVTNGTLTIGSRGTGQLTISGNSVVTARQVRLGGSTPGAAGTLHLSGDSLLRITTDCCNGLSANDVEQDGGRLEVSSASFVIGENHDAQYHISDGTALASQLSVGFTPGYNGTFTQSGGTVTITTNMTVGNCQNNATGTVTLDAGALYVTNAAHTAVLLIRRGRFTLAGGTLVVDKLVITNTCDAVFDRTGGTLIYGQLVLDPNLDADGDGLPNGWEQAHGLDPLSSVGNDGAAGDPDEDGLSNRQEYLAGTDPQSAASVLRVLRIQPTNNDVQVDWSTVGGHSYVVQRSGSADGSISTNFVDLSAPVGVGGTNEGATNYLHVGGATNRAGYYRVRLNP